MHFESFWRLRPWRNLCQTSLVLFGILGLAVSFSGCSTPLVPKKASLREIAQRDQILGEELSQPFQELLEFRKDPEISVFVKNLAQTLVNSTPELKDNSVGIWFLSDKKGKWSNYALPGNRIYLSASLIKILDFENELAAVVAYQLGHILKNHVVQKLASLSETKKGWDEGARGIDQFWSLTHQDFLKRIRYFGPGGIFSFSEEEEIAAAKAAVGILYRAGYDPRGMVSLCELFLRRPLNSPLEKGILMKMMEGARRELALFAPLRNPIIRSHAFLNLRKRMHQL